jgi:hypothetical protein
MTGEEIIARRREERKLLQAVIAQKAEATYATFDKNERTVLRFGMLPAGKMLKATAELIAELTLADGEPPDEREVSKDFAVAIMDVANRGPDKLVV